MQKKYHLFIDKLIKMNLKKLSMILIIKLIIILLSWEVFRLNSVYFETAQCQ